jgi:hypothetical protein
MPANTDLSRFDEGSSDEDDFIARVRASEAETATAVDDTFDEDDAEGTTGGGETNDANADDASRGASKRARAKEKKRKAKAERAKRRRAEEAQIRAKRAAGEDADDAKGGPTEASSDDQGGEEDGRTFHGTFNVEGVVMDDELVLVDKKSKAVYSSTERGPNGEHIRIGTWDEASESYTYWKPAEKSGKGGEDKTAVKPALNERGETIPAIFKGDAKLAEQFKAPTEVEHPFETDADDHCETSPEAHEQIANFLKAACGQLNKTPAELVIYDPYYCAGGTKRNLALIGFTNVINRNEDFYQVVEEERVPEHDVLLTNPPYSGDHIEKCVTFAAENLAAYGRPYLLLLPSYVIHKDYYLPALLTGGTRGKEKAKTISLQKAEREESDDDEDDDDKIKKHGGESRAQILPFYVAPKKRYYYWTPKAMVKARAANKGQAEESAKARRKRTHIGALGERTSPFLSFWYCCFGQMQRDVLAWHRKLPRADVYGYVVARHPNDLPLAVLDEWDPRRMAAVEKAKQDGVEVPGLTSYAGFTGAVQSPAKKKWYK